MRNLITALLLLSVTLFPLRVFAQQPKQEIQLSDDLQVYPFTENTWIHRSWEVINGTRYPSNGLIIHEGGTLTLIDTAWGETPTDTLLDWMLTHFGKAPDLAILTHSHDDRMGGAKQLAQRHIPTWVHPATLEIARQDPNTFYDPDIPAPQAISDFTAQSQVNMGNLQLYYPGPAHSPDNIVVWYAKDNLLIGGCAVKAANATRMSYVVGSDVLHWPDAMNNVLAHYPHPAVVIPGHGDPGDVSLLTHTRDLAQQGRKQAQTP